jgi:pyruvate kinase
VTHTPELFVTLCPSFPHFPNYARDGRLKGIRLNSAMLSPDEIRRELALAKDTSVPLWFDVKGRQLRVTEALDNPNYCDIRLNHPIEVDTPTVVLLKGGGEAGLLGEVLEDGYRLVFSGNPEHKVNPGESIHIRCPSLKVGTDPLFVEGEREKIDIVLEAGITRWVLSYVEEQSDIDKLKIESQRGLDFVANHYKKDEHTRLVAACGDLYVEVDQPHDILAALRTIIKADPDAIAASRMLLSLVREPVPSFADLTQLAWIYDQGYRTFMLCDELCLKDELLAPATNVFEAFRDTYPAAPPKPSLIHTVRSFFPGRADSGVSER